MNSSVFCTVCSDAESVTVRNDSDVFAISTIMPEQAISVRELFRLIPACGIGSPSGSPFSSTFSRSFRYGTLNSQLHQRSDRTTLTVSCASAKRRDRTTLTVSCALAKRRDRTTLAVSCASAKRRKQTTLTSPLDTCIGLNHSTWKAKRPDHFDNLFRHQQMDNTNL